MGRKGVTIGSQFSDRIRQASTRRIFDTARIKDLWAQAGPPLSFGLRLWGSVCLAQYVAFWLELDDPSWAGTAAAIVCQPTLGASLRKGWFRLIGTVISGVAVVVLTACFPQARWPFFISLALWSGACAFTSTLLRNFAAYAAALSGYTAVIITGDQLGSVGGLNGDAFMLAVNRVTEIGIGIISAGVVLAGTDLGAARRNLATLLADITAGIATKFAWTLQTAGPDLPDTQPIRRDFIRRVNALDPIIDQAIGESSEIRYHSPLLQGAVNGLFTALSGWRAIANHLVRVTGEQARAQAQTVLNNLPPGLWAMLEQRGAAACLANPVALREACQAGARSAASLDARTPSMRLLTDKTSEALTGLTAALDGLALLTAQPSGPVPRSAGGFRLHVADWLPAAVNGLRAFVTIMAVVAFWIVTAWPGGSSAITWAAIPGILFAARDDQAFASAKGFVTGTVIAIVAAAVINFAVLPNRETFAGLALAMGLWMIPAGAIAKRWPSAKHTYMASYFVPLLSPSNPDSFDTVQFYNSAASILAGAIAAAAGFVMIPPLAPAFRVRRLLALTLKDVRRLAMGQSFSDWMGHIHARLAAMPAEATPLQRAQLLAALSLGTEMPRLAGLARELGVSSAVDQARAAAATGRCDAVIEHLQALDQMLAEVPGDKALRARASILVIREVLDQHSEYFAAGAT